MKCSDENHVISAPEIVGYLQETCGIGAERRSVYKDIEEINKVMLIVGVLYAIFEILGFYLLDNNIKCKYNKARIYIEGLPKYKDILIESIREEKKWLVFIYHELGNDYVARIQKSVIERVEYYSID